ncbi:MAG: thioether cross-link-forming SCIFF peptide maturase [Oscillospiraceae bacterium]|nr:thioether cross-link-forming SCIFF peptide maturase [Oscillospiraceae bacterium]
MKSKVHLFTQLNKHFALDVGSGAIHLVTPPAFRLLSLIIAAGETSLSQTIPPRILQEVITINGIHEAWNELYALYNEGMLFSPDNSENLELPTKTPLKALCVHIAHDCNLRCGYCFADTGSFSSERGCMDIHTAKKAVDFLIERSGNRRNLEIDFFGGEPLLAFDVIKQAVEYARKLEKIHNKQFRFTLTTNGLLLNDDVISHINSEMKNVVLSLDGRNEVNDTHRTTIGGKGSYDVIVPKFQKVASTRKGDYFIRGTFTSKNLDFTEDILHIADLGFNNISIEPVVLEKGHDLEIREEHLPEIFAEYDRLTEILAARDDINFFHFNIDLEGGPCVYKRLRGCGAGGEYAAVTPSGSLYPCHQFAGRAEYKMGSVLDGSFTPNTELTVNHIKIRKGCSDCWAKYFCGGGCAAANLNINEDINIPYHIGCEMQKMRIECAIALKASTI